MSFRLYSASDGIVIRISIFVVIHITKQVAFLRDTKKMSLIEISEAFKRAYPLSNEWQKIAAVKFCLVLLDDYIVVDRRSCTHDLHLKYFIIAGRCCFDGCGTDPVSCGSTLIRCMFRMKTIFIA